eukprot:COSAG01_NODE_687_length_14245_cov_40.399548_16_plen_140_part_00
MRSLGEVYVVVAPAAISASSTLSVKIGKAGRPQAIHGNGTEQFYFLATTTADGTVDVEVSGGALSGLWLYAKSASSTAAATHSSTAAAPSTPPHRPPPPAPGPLPGPPADAVGEALVFVDVRDAPPPPGAGGDNGIGHN